MMPSSIQLAQTEEDVDFTLLGESQIVISMSHRRVTARNLLWTHDRGPRIEAGHPLYREGCITRIPLLSSASPGESS